MRRMKRRTVLHGLAAAPLAGLGQTETTPPPPPPLPQVSAGRIERLADFASRHVAARHVDVWLPPGFEPGRGHAVLYMHDGQMLFDASTTWNKQAWAVDAVAAPLLAARTLRPFMVVGVWNNGAARHAEYFPQKFLPHLQPPALRERYVAEALQGRPRADAYLRFLVEELKPAIDARFRPSTAAADTFLMGSSMGGLISIYGLLEHPRVFGGAAALSTHWIGSGQANDEIPAAALAYLADGLPRPGEQRIYMDRGTTELDAQYAAAQPRIDALMRDRGFAPPGFVTRVFEGAGHNEADWHRRLHIPLTFLLGA